MAKPAPAPPAGSLDAKLMSWGAGKIMYRVHIAVYAVDSFNPSPLGNARFSPIRDSAGNVIPTLYAATTPQGALMETVFHDVPYKSGFKRVSVSRLEGRLSSTLVFLSDFQLIDLGKIGLRGLGVHPHDLIDTTNAYRDRAQLRFLPSLKPPFPKLVLDTTVYIDALQGNLPDYVEIALRAGSLWHSTVTEAELAALAGLLDPKHPNTAIAIAQVAASIELRPEHRILTPDRDIWREAGILAGLLARLQQYDKNEQHKALNDALIFLTASRNGCVVLTRNVSDFDLLMQLDPKGQALFYDTL
jgi:predicted nucleic acid-binding protein